MTGGSTLGLDRKRALCIGVNYPGTDYALAGCVNDAQDWAAALLDRGYEPVILADRMATRDLILSSMAELVDSAIGGDRVVITYSGHGTWTPDLDGDELDGRDEAICPVDFRAAGLITDDDLYGIFSRAKSGVRLVFVADSCFSGTVERFAPPLTAGSEADPWSYRRARFLPPAVALRDTTIGTGVLQDAAALPAAGRARRSALTLSACSDRQTTYDAVVDGRPCGIFSHVALQVLGAAPGPMSYRDLMWAVRKRLPSVDYPDVTPQLDGTRTQRGWAALA